MSIIAKPLPVEANRVWNVTTEPTVEPITLAEFKLAARIDHSDEDDFLEDLISTVRQVAEIYLGRALLEQSITVKMDWWPDGEIELPKPPLIEITSVSTLDEDDVATAYAATNYYVTSTDPGILALRKSVAAPTNTVRTYKGFQIISKHGYGTVAANVPVGIREGLKLWGAVSYEDRIVSKEPPPEAVKLLRAYRRIQA